MQLALSCLQQVPRQISQSRILRKVWSAIELIRGREVRSGDRHCGTVFDPTMPDALGILEEAVLASIEIQAWEQASNR